MDERYFIVKNCLYALPYTALPQVRRFQLEVKLLKLRGKLLKQEGPPADLKDAIPFENLRRLVKELVRTSHGKDSYAEVSLLTELLEHAVENCLTTDALRLTWETPPTSEDQVPAVSAAPRKGPPPYAIVT